MEALTVKLDVQLNHQRDAQVEVDFVVDCVVSNQTGRRQIQTEIVEINFDETSEFLPRTKVVESSFNIISWACPVT